MEDHFQNVIVSNDKCDFSLTTGSNDSVFKRQVVCLSAAFTG
jgi:hypothetical protein